MMEADGGMTGIMHTKGDVVEEKNSFVPILAGGRQTLLATWFWVFLFSLALTRSQPTLLRLLQCR